MCSSQLEHEIEVQSTPAYRALVFKLQAMEELMRRLQLLPGVGPELLQIVEADAVALRTHMGKVGVHYFSLQLILFIH